MIEFSPDGKYFYKKGGEWQKFFPYTDFHSFEIKQSKMFPMIWHILAYHKNFEDRGKAHLNGPFKNQEEAQTWLDAFQRREYKRPRWWKFWLRR